MEGIRDTNVLYKVVPVGIIKTGKGWGKTLQ